MTQDQRHWSNAINAVMQASSSAVLAYVEVALKKRTKLALYLSAAAAVTGLVVSNIPASAAGAPQNFVLISIKDPNNETVITEYGADDSIIGRANPRDRTHYWYVNAAAAYVTVSNDDRTYRIPATGTLNQATDLPQCFRVTRGDTLHPATDQPCDISGASEGTWS
ncbi:MAG: hypothetical protein JO362_21165 [Streptomycetaceae bacterium]|nr:hypothetical protein [Streptomycetaceae bacterium]